MWRYTTSGKILDDVSNAPSREIVVMRAEKQHQKLEELLKKGSIYELVSAGIGWGENFRPEIAYQLAEEMAKVNNNQPQTEQEKKNLRMLKWAEKKTLEMWSTGRLAQLAIFKKEL